LTVESVDCGKTADDLSEQYRQGYEQELPEGQSVADQFEGQICLASATLRNNSNSSLFAGNLFATLRVQEEEYSMSGIDGGGTGTLTIFPDGNQVVTYVFDAPQGITPTDLELEWTDPENEDDIVVDI
jgi:hypothetical protein